MSQTALISERIAALEAIFHKSGNQLGLDARIGNGTVGGWNDNLIGKPSLAVKQFLRHYKIREQWWKTGEGDIFITHSDIEPAIAGKSLGESWEANTFRKMFEGGTDYILVPRTALDGKHRFTSVEQMEIQARELEEKSKELARKDEQIKSLTAALTGLMKDMSGWIAQPPKVEKAQKNTSV